MTPPEADADTPPPLPVTVISGYLGAGKTTLVNHLLRNAGGRRLMVLVNDFGEVNVDAGLLASATEDTLTLSNGCICCSIGGDFYYALADALDRRPRPDHLVIEASGVAEPGGIARTALAEPEMRYGGVITLADAANLAAVLADGRIGHQAAEQLAAADLVVLTKTDLADPAPARAAIARLTAAPVLDCPQARVPPELILDPAPPRAPGHAHAHDHAASYRSWSYRGPARVGREAVKSLLSDPAPGLYRLKGRVLLAGGGAVEAHLAGQVHQLTPIPEPEATEIAAIGIAPEFDPEDLARRWQAAVGADR